jgi:hypothetical protein
VEIAWGEVVRRYRPPGLFKGEERGLDASVDVESEAGRRAIEDVVRSRIELAAGEAAAAYVRLELSLFAAGERRHDCLFGRGAPEGEADEAHVLVTAWPERATERAEADRFELRLTFAGGGRPVALDARDLAGSLRRKRQSASAAKPLRERLDLVRASAVRETAPERSFLWLGRDVKSGVAFKARPILAALSEIVATLTPAQTTEVEALVSSGAALRDPSWLPLLARRKGGLEKLARATSCARCGREHAGPPRERRFDTRTGGLWGEAGVVFECPEGHEILKVVEERS